MSIVKLKNINSPEVTWLISDKVDFHTQILLKPTRSIFLYFYSFVYFLEHLLCFWLYTGCIASASGSRELHPDKSATRQGRSKQMSGNMKPKPSLQTWVGEAREAKRRRLCRKTEQRGKRQIRLKILI